MKLFTYYLHKAFNLGLSPEDDEALEGSNCCFAQEINHEIKSCSVNEDYDRLEVILWLAVLQPSKLYTENIQDIVRVIPDEEYTVKEQLLELMAHPDIANSEMTSFLYDLSIQNISDDGYYWYLYKSLLVLEAIGTIESIGAIRSIVAKTSDDNLGIHYDLTRIILSYRN